MPKTKPKVGLGITTYNRPEYLEQCIEGVKKNLLGEADVIRIYNDGSDKKHKDAYKKIYDNLPKEIKFKHNPVNQGVAKAKNTLVIQLLNDGCDYIFLLEDDIIIDSPKAISEYIRLSELSGIEHFQFAHHGEANVGMLYKSEKGVDCYTAAVGAYCMYTRKCFKLIGLFDEKMFNAMEHVEHSYRMQLVGLTTPYPLLPDLTKSREYMHEIPGSIDGSSIRPRKDWQVNILKALLYWEGKDPNFPLGELLAKIKRQIKEIDGQDE